MVSKTVNGLKTGKVKHGKGKNWKLTIKKFTLKI